MSTLKISQILTLVLIATNSWAAGYKGIYVGQPISSLPSAIHCYMIFCEGTYKGDFWRINPLDGKVLLFDVVYVGESLDNSSTLSEKPTLAKAIHMHSLQPGLAAPSFGLAKNENEQTYGIVDRVNCILYKVTGTAMDPASTVTEVTYLGREAPVVRDARTIPQSAALVGAAQLEK